MKKKIAIIAVIILCILGVGLFTLIKLQGKSTYKVDLTNLKYVDKKEEGDLKKYTQEEFETFLNDYNNGNLPKVYVTEFIFDGVSMMKAYDLDDYIEEGNDYVTKALTINAVNINTSDVELTGELTGMIAVNTNDIKKDINIVLNNVKIDTDSKKSPAIYVYNKDITYTDHKVTIIPKEGTKNYIEGGKLKKTSLIAIEELSNYTNNYSGDAKTWYETYTNYYGVYTKEQINNILFATVKADSEDLQDGNPYYYYKASGAISSDIDLYFEGAGYLSVTSKNKEGIETKGNLTFASGIGDYVVSAQDDCLNTTTSSSENTNARNTLTIDVNSLVAIVSLEADEGDAIDSNGTLTINGGTIIALSKPGQDAGLDSDKGTYINGGTVIATGDMYDEISSESKQNFIALSFNGKVNTDTLITLLDSNDNAIFSYKTDRIYSNLIYSSKTLKEGTYYLYKDGTIEGANNNGLYTDISSYMKGTLLSYSSTGIQGGMGMPNGMGQMNSGEFNGERPEMSNGENMTPPNMDNSERPEMPNQNSERPEIPSGDNMTAPDMNDNNERPEMSNDMNQNSIDTATASNKEFTISGIANIFSGVSTYSE